MLGAESRGIALTGGSARDALLQAGRTSRGTDLRRQRRGLCITVVGSARGPLDPMLLQAFAQRHARRRLNHWPCLDTDRHDRTIGVVALIPTFQDRGTKIGALASESVTTLVTFLI